MFESGDETIAVYFCTGVAAIIKLAVVTVRMLLGYLMINSDDTVFLLRPKAFHVVDLNFASRIFLLARFHALMSGKGFVQAVVCTLLVCHDRGFWRDVNFNDTWQGFGVGVFDGLCLHNFVVAVKRVEDRRFVLGASTAFVAFFLVVDVCFVGCNNTIKRLVEIFATHGITNTIKHMPSAFLRNAEVFSKLRRCNAFFMCGDQVYGIKPFLQRQRAIFEDCTDANRKFFLAIGTLEKFAAVQDVNLAITAAMHAYGLIAPALHRHKSVARLFGRDRKSTR